MMGELGVFSLVLGVCCAFFVVLVLFAPTRFWRTGPQEARVNAIEYGKALIYGAAICFGVSFLALELALLTNDFSVSFVASNSSIHLPIPFRFAALWGGHEGSMLLWLLILSAVVVWYFWGRSAEFVGVKKPHLHNEIALASLVLVAFGAFTLFTSNPFIRLLPFPPETGNDLNPLLQDPAMIMHPPLIYIGVLLLLPVYLHSVAQVIKGEVHWQDLIALKPWITASWTFLAGGIMLGSWWAYNELGWGGWWFWDPVENLSLIPWICATVLLHLMRLPKPTPGQMKFVLFLCILAFSLAVFATFAIRSGLLVSVHSFASDPKRGIFLLGILGLVLLPILRLPRCTVSVPEEKAKVAQNSPTEPQSTTEVHALTPKVGLILLNAVFAITVGATILVSVLYPPFHEYIYGENITVGQPYFHDIVVPITLLAVFFMALSPLFQRQVVSANLKRAFIIAGAIVVVLTGSVIAAFIEWYETVPAWQLVVSVWLTLWVFSHIGVEILTRIMSGKKFPSYHSGFWTMIIAHSCFAGLVLVSAWSGYFGKEAEVNLSLGESVTVGDWDWTVIGHEPSAGSNWEGYSVAIQVTETGVAENDTSHQYEGETIVLTPQKRYYHRRNQWLTEAAIHRTVAHDLYIAIGETLRTEDGAEGDDLGRRNTAPNWTMRIQIKPLLSWLWILSVVTILLGFSMLYGSRKMKINKSQQSKHLDTN